MNGLHRWFRERYPMHAGKLQTNHVYNQDYEVILSVASGKYIGLYIEVVKSGRYYTSNELHSLFALQRAKYKTEVCSSDGAVNHVIADYLRLIGKTNQSATTYRN